MADGIFRLTFDTGTEAYTDDGELAITMARILEKEIVPRVRIPLEVWGKDRSGWQKIYPV